MAVVAIVTWLTTHRAAAETYPNRPIHVIVPFPAGGSLDIGMRLIKERLSAALGVPLVIINRPGASGVLGMSDVAAAAPDGYTLGATSTSTLTVVQIGPHKPPYKPSEFTPIGNYAVDASVLIAQAASRWRSFDEFVADARAHPDKLTYGTPGAGTLSSLNMSAISGAFDLNMIEVPFQGTPQVSIAVIGKQIDVGATSFSGVAGQVKQGTVRALVIGGRSRLPQIPAVPTLQEKGLQNGGLNLVLGLYAPGGTPPSIIKTLTDALRTTMADVAVRAAFEKVGMLVQFDDGATLARQLDAEYRTVVELGRKLHKSK